MSGRPKIKEEKKRIPISVSVAPKVAHLAEKTDNKSRFLDTSVLGMQAITVIIERLRNKEITLELAMEDIEDYADVWSAQLDDTENYEFST